MTNCPSCECGGDLCSEHGVTSLTTLQFHRGGLFNIRSADGKTHLVRTTRTGTPGPTLCGIDRFAKNAPGFSVGGGVTGPDTTHLPCNGCISTAREKYPNRPITGLAADVMTACISNNYVLGWDGTQWAYATVRRWAQHIVDRNPAPDAFTGPLEDHLRARLEAARVELDHTPDDGTRIIPAKEILGDQPGLDDLERPPRSDHTIIP